MHFFRKACLLQAVSLGFVLAQDTKLIVREQCSLIQRSVHVSNLSPQPKSGLPALANTSAASIGGQNILQKNSRVHAVRRALKWSHDIFDYKEAGDASDDNLSPVWTRKDLLYLATAFLVFIAFDSLVLQSLNIQGLLGHLLLVGFWFAVGLAFDVFVWQWYGHVAGIQWTSGYILEWLLSVDNLFVFHLILKTFKAPACVIHKALFIGIVGAIMGRLCFFWVLDSLLKAIPWIHFFFGCFLIFSGIQAVSAESDNEEDVMDSRLMHLLRWLCGPRLVENYGEEESGALLVQKEGKTHITLMLPLVLCLETTDLLFAVDSVSAKTAQIPNFWISVSSTVVALFGLRAMFFVIQDLVDMFELLNYGLCFILVFIGVELIFADHMKLPPQVVCTVILAVFLTSIAGSTAKRRLQRDATQGLPPSEGTLET
mmetsp:Transcript_78522/g.138334  ORF Transcript_78522/g.138334 Transcript_78522/m.138334 type:complete len:428 (-) Transcript_78522:138-1421(-)|eukprot:CAMPEP_0197655290 /NCGR_PEP_ID=MMETSP1338-20131121/39366_1 /TAXON_ID=43686 ORGANISM="Pelagodinium beii, Strain RCC1491" /NCGR_SAMPLE_ID=MMETSP1338 /ASSEMBLY_ACC=CAM_ASM_000754 /LENGTH=427 /DNA_ID=CAMNT_0043230915 /DNA_START=99 /DNA_END=1382 /DNA_ORIENTATION=-